MSKELEEINELLRLLFPLNRSITGEANRQTLNILKQKIPIVVHEIPSGTKVFDWTVPNEWVINNAFIQNSKGEKIVDFQDNNLHVVSYSEPVDKKLTWEALKSHVHVHPNIPNAIPYRTSYYNQDWGFCLTHYQYDRLSKEVDNLHVVIDSNHFSGSMSYADLVIPGTSKKEILVSCYICHPSMANDSLSGVLVATFLARYLLNIKNRYWTYRFVFVPETIGALAYCAQNFDAVKSIDAGLVITTAAGKGKYGIKRSYDADHFINRVIEDVLRENNLPFTVYPFDIHGSDERQYSSPGFGINVGTLAKDKYYEYDFYHTSLDNLDFVEPCQLLETLGLYKLIIQKLEKVEIFQSLNIYGEPMLSKYDLYPKTGGAQNPRSNKTKILDIALWLMFLCDGRRDLVNIFNRLNYSWEDIRLCINILLKKGLLKQV